MLESQIDQPLDLRKYVAILRARKWTIVLVTVLVTGFSIFWSYRQTPIYQTSARLLLKQDPPTGYYPTAADEAEVVTGEAVAQVVVEQENLGMTPSELLSGVSATPLTQGSLVIVITYRSPDPALTQIAANGFARGYISYRREQAQAGIEGQREALQRRLGRLDAQLQALISRTEDAREAGNQSLVRQLEFQQSQLISRRGNLESEIDALPSTGTSSDSFGELLAEAGLPAEPSSPNHQTDGIMGLVLGLALGIGMGFLRERLDDRFRGRPDVERAMEAPVLATVPRFPKTHRSRELIVISDPKGAASEAYRNLRTSLEFLLNQRETKTLLVTSPSEHEGKTATTANLGFALAQTGRKVVLVSGDLRRPQLEKYFGVKAELGLSNYLLGEVDDIGQIVLEDPKLPGLRLLPSGPVPSNPAELLTSPRVAQLVSELEKHTDILIFDAPPVLPVADSVILASHIKTAVLIFDAANTQRSAATHAKELLQRVGADLVGCVLNAFDPSGSPYYYEPYYYSQYYSRTDEAREDGKRPSEERVETGVQLDQKESPRSQESV